MWDKILFFLRIQIKSLLALKKTKRSWQMPFAASISIGVPLFIGIHFDNMQFGLISSIGGMAFLYTPNTSLAHRMIVLFCTTTSITFCFFLGLISTFSPYALFIIITLMTIIASTVCRYFRITPPGPLFFIMSLSIAANMKIDITLIPQYTGLMFLGAFFATMVSLIYSFFILNIYPNQEQIPIKNNDIKFVFIDSVIIGIFVGISVIIAKLLKLDNFYWIPVSCLVVIQGPSFQDIWDKNLHRLIGTIIGLGLAWILFSTIVINPIYISLVIMILFFAVEMFVVRNYVIAAIFITALTILIAESGSIENIIPTGELILTRFIDIILGCLIGLVGGYVIYKTEIRNHILKILKLIGYNFKNKIN